MREKEQRYFYLYKPFQMLAQFSASEGKQTLADLDFVFPKDAYPIGRLDADSEGLLLITNDKKVNDLLLNPRRNHSRTYLAQVEREIDNDSCKKMEEGVNINVNGLFKLLRVYLVNSLFEKVNKENYFV